ncbi:Rid family hydrolase [Ruthenibacterium lactatiformans]|uniref:Rid family hydrolase n=1 Tax=Ruthenibacterium lactatiformans TaxID=1550024 RepID=UPI0013147346|nr:Rid family hydrolase [Ruthenibacterium lactatiformans]
MAPLIHRVDAKPGCSRIAVSNGVAWFTGHVSAKQEPTLREQAASVFARYEELFALHGLCKENILHCTAYVRDIAEFPGFMDAWNAWVDRENPPALVLAQAPTGGAAYLLELSFLVAAPETLT